MYLLLFHHFISWNNNISGFFNDLNIGLMEKTFLYRFTGSFDLVSFSETLNITALTFESFYCTVWEKLNCKFTPRVKVLSSICTISYFKHSYKSFLYMFAGSFNLVSFSVTLIITVFSFKSFYCIVFEKMNGKYTPRVNMLSRTYHFPFSNTHNNLSFIKSFYCMVLEKINGKITPKNKVHFSSCTITHFQTLIKMFP